MKKRFCCFLLFPLGISLFSCNSDSKKDENHSYTMEKDSHFVTNIDVTCKNGDSSSLSPDNSFNSVGEAEKATVTLEELSDGYRQVGDKVKILVTSDQGEKVTYEIENKLLDNYPDNLLIYHGELLDLPKGSLNFKIVSNLEEQEVELKSNFILPLDENNSYLPYFSGANNLDQFDFERLGYNEGQEMEYLSDHLYIKYSFDLGFGKEEVTFSEFFDYYMEHKEQLSYYKYKTSDAPYFDIYAKNEYLSFVCNGSYQPNNIQFKNPKKHIDKSLISMIDQRVINQDGKLGFRYKLNSPDSMRIIMDFANYLLPHDLIGIVFEEYEGMTIRNSNKWFQLESVNGISDNTRKYLGDENITLSGYAKTSDFTSANNNQIDIVYSLTSAGLEHKNELSNYVFSVYSGGSATFDSTTNKLTIKAKAPYLVSDPQYFSKIQIDARTKS